MASVRSLKLTARIASVSAVTGSNRDCVLNVIGIQMSKLLIVSVAMTSPLLLWAAIVAATRRNLFTPASMFSVLRVLHWIAVIVAVPLVLSYPHRSALYEFALMIFSFCLLWPEQWLKKRVSP